MPFQLSEKQTHLWKLTVKACNSGQQTKKYGFIFISDLKFFDQLKTAILRLERFSVK